MLDPIVLALRSVAAARVDACGRVLEASECFRALLPPDLRDDPEADVASVFVQPGLASLLAHPVGASGPVYEGLLTLGDPTGETRSLRGRVWRRPEGVAFVAERDVEELERLYASSIQLAQDLIETQRELAAANRRVRELSFTDPLTGVGNRRRLDERLVAEIVSAERHHAPLALMICDIDHFKRFNDRFGHGAGDRALVAFGRLLRDATRRSDVAARYGGEEFVLLLPHTGEAEALELAERLRAQLAAGALEGTPAPLTASFGVAALRRGESGSDLLRRADRALYRAKRAGRDRVEGAGE